MFTHPPPPVSLHSMATRLSQIRLSPFSSRSTKKTSFNHASSPTEPAKKSMYTARQVQRDQMAHSATKSQPAGTCRPHHQSHHQQDSNRTRPGSSCPLPETPRKPHHQDWNSRDNDNLMKSLPRKPARREPLQKIDPNIEKHSIHRGPRQHQAPAGQASSANSQGQARMSEMYTLIDDYMAWNMSSSNLELARPDSSGTMFVDFGSNGEMEVSYRNGVNKKLPTPPVPSKIPTPSKPTSRNDLEIKQQLQPTVQLKDSKQSKPLPPRPSQSSRHDSVTSSGAEHKEQIDPFQARPLPQIPSQSALRAQPQSRKLYPPQVHRTQHSSSQTRFAHHSFPTSSQITTPSHHTAPSTRNGEAYTLVEPSGLTMHYHPPIHLYASDTKSKPDTRGYVSGYDPTTYYAYDYDGRTLHVHRSPTPSRPESRTSEYFDIPASAYNPSLTSYNNSTYTSCKPTTSKAADKALSPLPTSAFYSQLPEPPRADVKKRRKVLKFVQKLLHKLDNLGVMEVLSPHRHRHSAPVDSSNSWVERGHVT